MTCYTYHLYIEYDLQTGAYHSNKLRRNGDPTLTWGTGDAQADWKACHDFAERLNLKIQKSRSVRDFVSGVPGWCFDGQGMLQAAQSAHRACDANTEDAHV